MSQDAFTPKHSTIEMILTPLSIIVAAVGVVLVILGPGLLLVERVTEANPAGRAQNPSTVAGLTEGSDDDIAMTTDEMIARQFVPFTIVPERPRNTVINYLVKPGDTLLAIAESFGLEPNTLVWSNNHRLLGDVHMLQRDMELFILPVDGAYHRSDETLTITQIADRYGVEAQDIIDSEYNNLQGANPSDVPPWGMWIVVPEGAGQAADLYKPVVVQTQDEATGTVVNAFMPGMRGSCAAGIAGSGGTGGFGVPLNSFAFTQGFYPGHSGIDMAAPIGTPVFAADSGVVIFSGWVSTDWGYGVLVVLDHGNGFTTYYAHLNSTSVGCGQFVSKGGAVGTVGSTGQSSGAHLHFEIRTNHIPVDPTGYIGY